MPNSICPRNSIFHRLFLNWGENIPKYFRSCSRVLKAIMLSFPMSVPFVVFCAWLFYHIQQLEPIFRLFHFPKLISPNKTRTLIVFRGQKLGIFQDQTRQGKTKRTKNQGCGKKKNLRTFYHCERTSYEQQKKREKSEPERGTLAARRRQLVKLLFGRTCIVKTP